MTEYIIKLNEDEAIVNKVQEKKLDIPDDIILSPNLLFSSSSLDFR